MKIAVIGYKGRLGSQLVSMGCVPLECDITSVESIQSALAWETPDVIINCAAYTDVDGCEREWKRASLINLWGGGKT